jgi:hypothetical protein
MLTPKRIFPLQEQVETRNKQIKQLVYTPYNLTDEKINIEGEI